MSFIYAYDAPTLKKKNVQTVDNMFFFLHKGKITMANQKNLCMNLIK